MLGQMAASLAAFCLSAICVTDFRSLSLTPAPVYCPGGKIYNTLCLVPSHPGALLYRALTLDPESLAPLPAL
jgi:hypothetical protein